LPGVKLVLCMKWGSLYGAHYVNRLHAGARRHVSGPLQFVCLTDDSSGIDPAVECRPLPAFNDIAARFGHSAWRKLELWRRDLGDDLLGREALFLDLDLVLVGPLDAFWDFKPGRYAAIENWSKPGMDVGNTSVFRFVVGGHPEIFERYDSDPARVFEREFRIEQEYISARLGNGRAARTARGPAVARDPFYQGLREQVFWPKGWCVSFKEELLPAWPMRLWRAAPLPRDAKIIVFHGKPDPADAMAGVWPEPKRWKRLYKRLRPAPWIAEHWR